jgi:hypothetical protein
MIASNAALSLSFTSAWTDDANPAVKAAAVKDITASIKK